MLDEKRTQDAKSMIDNNVLNETPTVFLLLQLAKHPLDSTVLVNETHKTSLPQAMTTADARALLEGKSDTKRCMEIRSNPSSLCSSNVNKEE